MRDDPLRAAVDEVVGRAAAARLDDLDEATRRALLSATFDAFGIAAGGEVAPSVAPSLAALLEVAGAGDVPVPWWGQRLAPPDAAFALSLLIHAWDFDDTHDAAVLHACAVTVPAAYATAYASDASGTRFLEGVLAGSEVVLRLSLAVGAQPGVIRTAGLGALGAAAASARVLGLDAATTAAALSLAVPQAMAPTTRQVVEDGALAKRHQPAFAVRHGVLAAALARHGVAGATGWFGGSYGLGALVADTEAAASHLAAPGWEVARLSLKPYPACRYLHAAIAGTLELTAGQPTTDVDHVTVHVPEGMAHVLVARPWERRGDPLVDAQFSIPWAVATAVARGSFDLERLTGDDLTADDVDALARRVTVVQDLTAGPGGMTPVTVEVVGHDGSVRRTEVTSVPGSPDMPLDGDAIAAKVRGCLRAAGHDPERADDLRTAVESLPERALRDAFAPFAVADPPGGDAPATTSDTHAPDQELATWTSA